MYKKILIPLDGSKHSKKAVEYAKEIASKFEADIILFFSYEVTDVIGETMAKIDSNLQKQFDEMEKYTKNYGLEMLNNIEKELNEFGIKTTKIIQKGKASEEIVSITEKEKCDLIVMGRRGMSTLQSALIGSTSNYVLHHTDCPVCLIN